MKTSKIEIAINWWEKELSSDERVKLLPISWSEIGDSSKKGIEKRHAKLLEMYNQFHKKIPCFGGIGAIKST